MPSWDTKIFDLINIKSLIKRHLRGSRMYKRKKIDGCKNNLKNASTAKVSKHIPSDFSVFAICLLRSIESKHDVYRGQDCMKRFLNF